MPHTSIHALVTAVAPGVPTVRQVASCPHESCDTTREIEACSSARASNLSQKNRNDFCSHELSLLLFWTCRSQLFALSASSLTAGLPDGDQASQAPRGPQTPVMKDALYVLLPDCFEVKEAASTVGPAAVQQLRKCIALPSCIQLDRLQFGGSEGANAQQCRHGHTGGPCVSLCHRGIQHRNLWDRRLQHINIDCFQTLFIDFQSRQASRVRDGVWATAWPRSRWVTSQSPLPSVHG